MKFRAVVLVFANIVAVIILLYFLELFGIYSAYSSLKDRLPGKVRQAAVMRIDDPALIEKEEQAKMIESLQMKETDLAAWEADLKIREEAVLKDAGKTAEEKQQIIEMRKAFELEKQQRESYQEKVRKLADQYSGMPPDKSAVIILGLKDDLLILDVLKGMDQIAASKGQSSIVPFLLTLMPPEDAARLQRKSTVD